MVFENINLEQLPEVAILCAQWFDQEKVCVLEGQMGAGKTTFAKELVSKLGAKSTATSPSFGIVNEYPTQENGVKIYHFDCYRFNSEEEAYDIGLEEYIDSGNICLIEWAEKIESLLPSSYLVIKIEVSEYNLRNITITKHG